MRLIVFVTDCVTGWLLASVVVIHRDNNVFTGEGRIRFCLHIGVIRERNRPASYDGIIGITMTKLSACMQNRLLQSAER